jgi:hypothetical protein
VSGFPAALAYFALGLFWVHTLLIAAAGLAEARELLRAYAGKSRRIVVSSGAGPEGQFAVHRVRQVGRSRGDGKVWFHDRAYESELFGEVGEVWPGREQQVEAAACPNAQVLAEARGRASKAAGWERTVEVEFTEGDAVWLFPGPGGQVVAGEDPRGWRTRVLALTGALAAGLVGAAAVVTAMCLAEPAFGTISKIGAFAGVVVFNLFQLFGKLHHEAIQPPSRRALLGRWG